MQTKNPNDEPLPKPEPQRIEVAVVTTSGSWPHKGFENALITQPIETQLQQAVKKLKITDTTNWVAKVGTRELKVDRSYAENGLSGEIEIDYGPREGGGGDE